MTGNATAQDIFRVGHASTGPGDPGYIFIADTANNLITFNAPISLSSLELENVKMYGSGKDFIMEGTGGTGGNIKLQPDNGGSVYIYDSDTGSNMSLVGNTLSSDSGLSLYPGSGNVNISSKSGSLITNYLYFSPRNILSIPATDNRLIHADANLDIYSDGQIEIRSGLKKIKSDAFTLTTSDYNSGTLYTNGTCNLQSTSSDINLATTITNSVNITSVRDAVSSQTGAFIVSGGIGVSKKLYVGGDVHISGILYMDTSINSSNTSTGSVVVTGGVGIRDDVWIGGKEKVQGILYVTNATPSVDASTGSAIISGGVGINGNLNTSATIKNWSSINSDSYQTGSIVTTGGIGISQNLNVNGNTNLNYCQVNIATEAVGISTGAVYVAGGVNIKKSLITGGNISVTSNTPSVSTSTGAMIITGGIGLSGSLNVGSDLKITGTTTGNNFLILSSQESNSTDTGALQVIGGVGIGGSSYFGGVVHSTNVISASNTLTGSLVVNGGVGSGGTNYFGGVTNIINTAIADASKPTSGALVVTGGVNIIQNLVVGSNMNSSNVISGAVVINGGIGANGINYFGGNTHITSTNDAFSSDITIGALVVSGGLAVQQSGYIRSTIESTSTSTGSFQIFGGLGIGKRVNIGSNINSSNITTGALVINGGMGSNGTNYLGGVTNIINTATADASKPTSGALVVTGGVNIIQNLAIGSSILASTINNAGALVVNGGCGIGQNLIVKTNISGDTLNVTSHTNAVDTETGAAIISGGIGCAGDIYCANEFINNTLYTNNVTKRNGTGTTFTNGTQVFINDITESANTQSGSLQVSGGIGVAKTTSTSDLVVYNTTTTNTIHASSSYNSTSISSGTIIVTGGVGVSQSLYAYDIHTSSTLSAGLATSPQTITLTGSLVVAGGMGVYGNSILNDSVQILSGVDSDSTMTGAMTIKGGLGVGGYIYSTHMRCTTFIETSSDKKFKENIDYENILGLEFINKLKPCKYNLKDLGSKKSYGLIAQDVKEMLDNFNVNDSQIVTEDKLGLKLGYTNLISILIKSVQELNEKINNLQDEIKMKK